MLSALDSLEAAFSKEVLQLTDADYGFLVSVSGAGVIAGRLSMCSLIKMPASLLMGMGSLFTAVGYMIYAFSDVFGRLLSDFSFSLFLAFANTGFQTFYQKCSGGHYGESGELLFISRSRLHYSGNGGFRSGGCQFFRPRHRPRRGCCYAGVGSRFMLVLICSLKRRTPDVFQADQCKQT